MNLPNFVNYEPFNKLRKKMGTIKLGNFVHPMADPRSVPALLPENVLPVIGAFAAMEAAQGRTLCFTGGPDYVLEAVDAGLIADALYWAAEAGTARNEIFNITNGDVFAWRNVWPAIAAALGATPGSDAPQRLAVGDSVIASEKADIKPGNAMPFSGLPIGTIVHNIELKPGKGGQIARAAGTYAQFVGRDGGYAQIRLSSGELRMVRQECMATVGAVSNPDNSNQNYGKAGRMRHKGIRPSVRGVVMNPIDHPHGGGEGRTSGGRHPVTPWGKPTKGAKTRKNKATDKYIVRSRHARKKGR